MADSKPVCLLCSFLFLNVVRSPLAQLHPAWPKVNKRSSVYTLAISAYISHPSLELVICFRDDLICQTYTKVL